MIEHRSDKRPVPEGTPVIVDLGDGTRGYVGFAEEFNWGPGAGPEGEGRIVRYDVLVPQSTARAAA